MSEIVMTPHRMLYEALTLDEYKRFCRNFDPSFQQDEFLQSISAADALENGFCWSQSSESYTCWRAVCERLYLAEQ